MTPIRIQAVLGSNALVHATLANLQAAIMPLDVPADTLEGYWWLALEGHVPVAFAGLHESRRVPKAGYLCRAGVLTSHRGRGLQRRLIAIRERKARALGFTAIHTDTVTTNPVSSNNLIASGFRMHSPTPRWLGSSACYWIKKL